MLTYFPLFASFSDQRPVEEIGLSHLLLIWMSFFDVIDFLKKTKKRRLAFAVLCCQWIMIYPHNDLILHFICSLAPDSWFAFSATRF